jgi:hypothetical protein
MAFDSDQRPAAVDLPMERLEEALRPKFTLTIIVSGEEWSC